MAVVAVVVTNLIHLVIMVDLVAVDQMVVVEVLVYIQDHLLLMHLDKVMKVELVNPHLLVVAADMRVVVLMLLDQLLEQVVLEHHIVLLASQHTMLLAAEVVIDAILVVLLAEMELVVMVEDNPQRPVLEMVKAELVPVAEVVVLNQQ
tara:strand:+ start:576 stop:1019 length:444 start_codon:yes stop_codon:yes gene_type:complete